MQYPRFVLRSGTGRQIALRRAPSTAGSEATRLEVAEDDREFRELLLTWKNERVWIEPIVPSTTARLNGEPLAAVAELRLGDRLHTGVNDWVFEEESQSIEAPAAPQYELLSIEDHKRTPINKNCVAGRDASCDLVVERDYGVSRRHCEFSLSGEGVWLEDLGSANGTFVNGKRIETKTLLRANDRIRIDQCEFLLLVNSSGSESPLSVTSLKPGSSWTRDVRRPAPPLPRSTPGASLDPAGLQTVFAHPLARRSEIPPPAASSLRAPIPLTEQFKYSVTAPRSIRPGESFLLEVWAHLPEDTREVIERALESSVTRDIFLRSTRSQAAPAGSIVEVHLRIPSFYLEDKSRLDWRNKIGNASFFVSTPTYSANARHAGTASFFVGDFLLGSIAFELLISDQHSTVGDITQSFRRVTSGFASYAEADHEQVNARVQGILSAAPDLDLFLDVTQLRRKPSGADDARAEIAARDIFYLFWSHAASESRHVEEEWRFALRAKGLDAISPVPLVDPKVLFPPAELMAIPFKRWVPAQVRQSVSPKPGVDELPGHYTLSKYKISEALSRGGFGITYKATDEILQRTIVVKEYFPKEYAYRGADLSVQPHEVHKEIFKWGLQRFLDEARALAMFKHSHIVRIHDHFESNSTAYLAMDFEEGTMLASLLEGGSVGEKFLRKNIISPILDGLHELHSHGMLHRDIKPENIIVRDRDQMAVLIDFGASRIVSRAVGKDSEQLTTLVSFGYSPIEQCLGHKQGPYTDIYALSATIYRALTGNPPPDAVDRWRHTGGLDKLPGLEAARKRYSAALIDTVGAGLRLQPEVRLQSAAEFAAMLEQLDMRRRAQRRSMAIVVAAGVIAGSLVALVLAVARIWPVHAH